MSWREIDRYLTARGVRIGAPTVAQTTGGTHADGSAHYAGLARDYGARSGSDLTGVLAALTPLALAGQLTELYGLETFIKNGKRFTPKPALYDSHQGHVHAVIKAGVTLSAPTGETAGVPASTGGGGLPNPLRPLIKIAQVFAALLNPSTWVRLAQILAGVTLTAWGLIVINRDAFADAVGAVT